MGRWTRSARIALISFVVTFAVAVFLGMQRRSPTRAVAVDRADAAAIIQSRGSRITLAGGSIIDLHDSTESDDDALRLARPLPMIEALPAIIDGLGAKGYQLVGLDDMELVDPIEWTQDERGKFGSAEVRDAIHKLGNRR